MNTFDLEKQSRYQKVAMYLYLCNHGVKYACKDQRWHQGIYFCAYFSFNTTL